MWRKFLFSIQLDNPHCTTRQRARIITIIFLQSNYLIFESQRYEYHPGTHSTQQMEHECRGMGYWRSFSCEAWTRWWINTNAFESMWENALLDIPTQHLTIVRRRARIIDQKSSWYACLLRQTNFYNNHSHRGLIYPALRIYMTRNMRCTIRILFKHHNISMTGLHQSADLLCIAKRLTTEYTLRLWKTIYAFVTCWKRGSRKSKRRLMGWWKGGGALKEGRVWKVLVRGCWKRERQSEHYLPFDSIPAKSIFI